MTQVSEAPARTRAQIAEKTFRQDPWWRQPAIVATLLSGEETPPFRSASVAAAP